MARQDRGRKEKLELVVVEKSELHSQTTRITISEIDYAKFKAKTVLKGKNIADVLGDIVRKYIEEPD